MKLDFEKQWALVEDTFASRLMAIAHSIWLQASVGYLNVLPQYEIKKISLRFQKLIKIWFC